MTDLKAKNLSFFAERDKTFSFTAPESRKNIEIVKAKSGDPTLKYNAGRNGVFLHSFYNPVEEAKNMVKPFRNARFDQLVVFGIGLGYHLREILNYNPAANKVILVETDPEIFEAALETMDFREILGQREVKVLLGSDIGAFQHEFKKAWEAMRPAEFLLFEHLPSKKVFFEFYVRAREFFMSYHIAQANNWDDVFASRIRMQKNTLLNIKHLIYACPVRALFDRFAGKTAFLVIGSDLKSETLDLLARFGQSALIVADISALPMLSRAGIAPQLIFCAAHTPTEIDPATVAALEKKSCLLFTPQASTETLDVLDPLPKFVYGLKSSTYDWLGRMGAGSENIEMPEYVPLALLGLLVKLDLQSVIFAFRLPPDHPQALMADLKKKIFSGDVRCYSLSAENFPPIEGVDPKTVEEVTIQMKQEPFDFLGQLEQAYKAGRRDVDEEALLKNIRAQKDQLEKFIDIIARADDFYREITKDLDKKGQEFVEECHIQSVHMERMKYEILSNPELLDFIEPHMHPAVLLQSKGTDTLKAIVNDLERIKEILRNDSRLYAEMRQAARAVQQLLETVLSQPLPKRSGWKALWK